jgi:metal-responsive CopG/Arc/MetJ family transcriptional regulator
MRAVITLPEGLAWRTDRLARYLRKSRNEVIRAAVAEYVASHDSEAVTEALNRLARRLVTKPDAQASEAARRVLRRSEW